MIYLDTSVLVSLLVTEVQSDAVREWIGPVQSAELMTSDWATLEFASAMGIKVRQKGLDVRTATRARHELEVMLADSLELATPSRNAYRHAEEVVAQYDRGMRGGDALHLAVAIEEDADQFVTTDGKLARAARELSLPIRVVVPG